MHLFRFATLAALALWLGCGSSAASERATAGMAPSGGVDAADPLRTQGPARFVSLRDIHSRIRATPHKLVLLHMWATWCSPCMEEMPAMTELARSLPLRDIELFSVAMDNATRKNAVRVSRVIDQKAAGALTRAIARFEDPDAFVEGIDPRWEGSIPALMAYLPSGQLVGALYGEASREEIVRFVDQLGAKSRSPR